MAQWLPVARESVSSGDRSELIVRRLVGEDSYETVFGQFITAGPGALHATPAEQGT